MHIAIVAPGTPAPLADNFYPADRMRARSVPNTNSTAPARIAREMLSRGHQVTFVTYQPGEREMRLAGDRLSFIRISSPGRARDRALSLWRHEINAMAKEVAASGADLAHGHWSYEFALAAMKSPLPTVITVRDAPLSVIRHDPSLFRILRYLLAWRVRIRENRVILTAGSPFMASAWRRQMLSHSEVRLTPNFIADDELRTDRTAASRTPNATILDVADSSRNKNIPTLIGAFYLVKAERPDCELTLIGAGLDSESELAQRTRHSAMADSIHFLGHVSASEVSRAMRTSWLHVHVALQESFGNTVVEALAAGTPVIGGERSGAVPWVLERGDAGVLTNVRDKHKLAGAILDLLDHQDRREHLAEAGIQRVRRELTASAVMPTLMDTYESALSTQHRNR